MTRRYLLCPGLVRSATDRCMHYVDAVNLAQLYGVQMSDCIVLPRQRLDNHLVRMELLARASRGELVGLTVRSNGDYTLPPQPHRYGCHNRAPLAAVVDLGGRSIPFNMAAECRYTLSALGQSDSSCDGCRWRSVIR